MFGSSGARAANRRSSLSGRPVRCPLTISCMRFFSSIFIDRKERPLQARRRRHGGEARPVGSRTAGGAAAAKKAAFGRTVEIRA